MRSYLSFALTCLLVPSVSADVLTDLTENHEDQPDIATLSDSTSALHGLLGGLVYSTDHSVGESKRKAGVFPLVFLSYADTVQWTIGGGTVWLLKSNDRSTRLGASLRIRGGYTAEDDTILAGMADRDRSVEAGLSFRWRQPHFTLGTAYYQDISGKTKGDSASVRLSFPFRLNQQWGITPSLGAEWLSANVVDYYYGVRTSEATVARPAYIGKSTTNWRAGIAFNYHFAPRWLLLSGLGYTKLGSGITQSPIVNRDSVTTVFAGVGWVF